MTNQDSTFEFIRIDLIDPSAVPDPRIIPSTKAQDEADAASIKKHGLLQPLVVGPMSETTPAVHPLIAGRRRFRLCKSLGMTHVPCYVRNEPSTPENVKGLFRDMAAAENIHRAEMHAVEVAAEILRRAEAGQKQKEIGEALKLGTSNVSNYVRLARAPFFATMLHKVKEGEAVPSYRKCLQLLQLPTKGESGAEAAKTVLDAFNAECKAEERAIKAAAEKGDGKAAPGGKARAGKGEGGGGGASMKPRKWAEIRDWWKEAQKAIKSGVHPVTGEALTDAESISLKACDELLKWAYKSTKKAEPPIFVMGPPEEESQAEGGADSAEDE